MNRLHLPPLCLLACMTALFLWTLTGVPDIPSEPAAVHSTGIAVLTHPLAAGEERDGNEAARADVTRADDAETGTPSSDARDRQTAEAAQPRQTGEAERPSAGPQLHTTIGSVEIFPESNEWNQRVDDLPVHEMSSVWLRSIGLDKGLHPDFGTTWRGAPNGIPFVVVSPDQPRVPVTFQYADESDPGPYPIPPNPPIEGGREAPLDSDRHVIMIDPQQRLLYELFHVVPDPVVGWRAGSGAIFDLSRNHYRPLGWTSADAAGLPIFPGLVRYDEVKAGAIRHALRFTVARTQRAYVFPARHFASRSSDPNLPPMGLRVRLRADFDVSGFPPDVQVILTALQRYGMLLADNGSDWFISGAPDPRWNDSELGTLKRVTGRDLECVDTGKLTR